MWLFQIRIPNLYELFIEAPKSHSLDDYDDESPTFIKNLSVNILFKLF